MILIGKSMDFWHEAWESNPPSWIWSPARLALEHGPAYTNLTYLTQKSMFLFQTNLFLYKYLNSKMLQ